MKKVNKWIDIKKKVPDRSDDFLVCDRNGVMFVCAYYPEEKRWFINGADGPYYSEDWYLRFWMELPEEPEGLCY
jgi:hypothetical protein